MMTTALISAAFRASAFARCLRRRRLFLGAKMHQKHSREAPRRALSRRHITSIECHGAHAALRYALMPLGDITAYGHCRWRRWPRHLRAFFLLSRLAPIREARPRMGIIDELRRVGRIGFPGDARRLVSAAKRAARTFEDTDSILHFRLTRGMPSEHAFYAA